MDIVARIAAGADAAGIGELFIVWEPFRIAVRALQWMRLRAKVSILDTEKTHTAKDTTLAIEQFRAHGVDHVVSLGGDGTHRIVAKTAPDLHLIPLSTGTNNVYPLNVEPTVAGSVAALGARGLLPVAELTSRSKVAHLRIGSQPNEIGLIDVVRIENDFVGNYQPFNPAKIRELVLTRALPDAIGMSPIGGLVEPVEENDDAALYVQLGTGPAHNVAVSPGLFKKVHVARTKRLRLGQDVVFEASGLIALDGDRLHTLDKSQPVRITVRRDGPYVYDVAACMRHVAKHRML